MSETRAMLELENVVFRYEDSSCASICRVARGECVAVIGPSGAGKSTLLALIAGFETPECGRILIAGEDVTGPSAGPPARHLLFQDHNLFAHLSVAANVGLGIHPGLRISTPPPAPASAPRWIRSGCRASRRGCRRSSPAASASGWRWPAAWCATGRCCCWTSPSPPWVRRCAARCWTSSMRCARDLGFTLLFVSHQPEDARHAATRTAFVHAGHVLQVGATRDLLDGAAGAELRAYLGEFQIRESGRLD